MSWEYWPPRSMTSTGRSSAAGRCTTFDGSAAIVRRLFRDGDVVRVRFAQPRSRDANEARALEILDGRCSAIAHRLAHAADELVDDRCERALVRDPAFDPLGNELVDALDAVLEIPVLREAARFHRAERAHAAVLLEALALVDDDLAGRLVRPREHRPDHDRARPGRERLGNVA